jgi:hypothetical protein
VKPFNTLLRVPENPNMRSRFQELFSRKGYIDRLFTLTFKGSSSMEENLRNGEQLHVREGLAKEYACMLSWRFEKLEGKPERGILFGLPSPGSTVNFKVLACCCLAVGGSETRIGDILNDCYRCGVLEQPTSTGDIEKYSIQILIVFQALFILNFVRPLGNPEGANLRPDDMASSARQYRQWINTIDYFWLIKDSDPSYLAKLLGLSVRDFFNIGELQVSTKVKETDIECASGILFRLDDLNLYAL